MQLFSELMKSNQTTSIQDLHTCDDICRYYNRSYSIPTGTKMQNIEGEYIITGSLISREGDKFMYRNDYCNVVFDMSIVAYLSSIGYDYEIVVHNGQSAILLLPIPKEDIVQYKDSECDDIPCMVTTTESKIPRKPNPTIKNTIIKTIDECKTVNNILKTLNTYGWGEWMIREGKLYCMSNDKFYIYEMDLSCGKRFERESLYNELQKAGLDAIYLVQCDNFFFLASDDKRWERLLKKDKYNKIEGRCDDMSDEDLIDSIKQIISTYN